jgi:hypothetical protein
MSNEDNKFPEWSKHLQSLPEAEELEEFVEDKGLPEIKISPAYAIRGLEGDIGLDELAFFPDEEVAEEVLAEEVPAEEVPEVEAQAEEVPAKKRVPMQSSVKAMLNAKEKPAGVQRYLGRRTKY